MQARAGAVDELLASGVLEDVGGDTDDIQKELDEAGTAAGVDQELAALKAEIGPGASGGSHGARKLTPSGTRGRPAAEVGGSPVSRWSGAARRRRSGKGK